MFNQFAPTVQATLKFLQLLNVDVTSTTVNESLQNHPEWPSLLCISDTLSKWNIANGAGSLNPYELDCLPTPFLARINSKETPLVVVSNVSEHKVTLYQGNFSKLSSIDRQVFIDTWSGIYLIAETNPLSGEPQFAQRRKQVLMQRLIPTGAIALLLILLAALTQRLIPTQKNSHWWVETLSIYIQAFIFLGGIAVSSALIWYDIDKNNPLLKRVCTNLVKSDCNAILSSKQAKLFSWMSWSEVGLIYFTGSLLAFLLSNLEASGVRVLLAWLSILALPYTFFSVYYQWQVAKQWCALCLIVQMLLVLGALNAAASGMLISLRLVSLSGIALLVLCYTLFAFAWYSFKPIALSLFQAKATKRNYLRLKFNAELFETLLRKQRRITPVKHLGITLGNPDATHTLIKVCSPYCGPCSKAHPEIEKLLESNKDLKVNIIFFAPNPEANIAVKPIRHLLAIASQEDSHVLHQALDDWYLPENKNYDRFAARYPMEQTMLEHYEHIVAMNIWCEEEGIYSTPTIFLNGYQLPISHNLEDLHYLLLDLPSLVQQVTK